MKGNGKHLHIYQQILFFVGGERGISFLEKNRPTRRYNTMELGACVL